MDKISALYELTFSDGAVERHQVDIPLDDPAKTLESLAQAFTAVRSDLKRIVVTVEL